MSQGLMLQKYVFSKDNLIFKGSIRLFVFLNTLTIKRIFWSNPKSLNFYLIEFYNIVSKSSLSMSIYCCNLWVLKINITLSLNNFEQENSQVSLEWILMW